jgi:glucose/arabinose dehydrogenase
MENGSIRFNRRIQPAVALALASGILALFASMISSCKELDPPSVAPQRGAGEISQSCQAVESGYGTDGKVEVTAERWATGLEVPWGLAFLPSGNALVTERPGRVRHVSSAGSVSAANVATVDIASTSEGGLLGLAIDPGFASNRFFYVYYTATKSGGDVNRVQRFTLSADERSASAGPVIIDDIAAAAFHDGGALRFGPDGKLYAGAGDARVPGRAQDPASRNGKILRLNPDGSVPGDNPTPGQPGFVLGLRNPQGFDWINATTLAVVDHGPTGEINGWTGSDEVSFAQKGSNLGWPRIHRCETAAGLVAPALSWYDPVPPGGALFYRGDAIPEWKGDLLVGILGGADTGLQLHRVILAKGGSTAVVGHEAYFRGEFGRLRNVVQGPDGLIYVTTSNCDTRGSCPAEKDVILRVRKN